MLKDIRSEISTLSLKFDLQQRYLRELKDNHTTIVKMRQDLRQSIRRYQKESMDVERLQRLSIRSLILSLAGKKNEQLRQETVEMLAAKSELDRINKELKIFEADYRRIEQKLAPLKNVKASLNQALKRKKEIIRSHYPDIARDLKTWESLRNDLLQRKSHIQQAIVTGRKVRGSLTQAAKHLSSADGWAFGDLLLKGMLIGIIKYQHIGNAKAHLDMARIRIKRLNHQMKDFSKLQMRISSNEEISRLFAVIDVFIDDIFTDVIFGDKVRVAQIKVNSQLDAVNHLIRQLNPLAEECRREIKKVDARINHLIRTA
ncbi:hypothetical protein QQ056_04400 [Oscillatoria laete-virens NRMC-F 0139]|nr:hypothetical protein [Oscillatoria laete-virens]MDL5052803.1 hypothetical protein [Oscillatoria laete-virens NRMC-F 0139]